jgi:hypothetical protein
MSDVTNNIIIAQKAKQLLESQLLDDVFSALKKEAYESWYCTDPASKDAREDLYYYHVALAKIENKIKSLADEVKIESAKEQRDLTKVI